MSTEAELLAPYRDEAALRITAEDADRLVADLTPEEKEQIGEHVVDRAKASAYFDEIDEVKGTSRSAYLDGTRTNIDITINLESEGAVASDIASDGAAAGIDTAIARTSASPEAKVFFEDVATQIETPEGEEELRNGMKDKSRRSTARKWLDDNPGYKIGIKGGIMTVSAVVLYMVITGKSPEDLGNELIVNPIEELMKEIMGALEALGKWFAKEFSKVLKIVLISLGSLVGLAVIGVAIWLIIKYGVHHHNK
jgi:hypothetical protein